MHSNDGYAYRERLTPQGIGKEPQDVLRYLSRRYPHSSSAEWQARLDDGQVWLEGRRAGGREQVTAGQELVWHRPPWAEQDVPLHFSVIYQDTDLIAVSKPSGLPTLPGGGFLDHTLLHLVRQSVPGASPLHRLGRGTSGLVLFARTPQAAAALAQDWRNREVGKIYLALASGQAENGRYDIRTPIGPVPHPRLGTVYAASPLGKASRSIAEKLEQRVDSALFRVDLLTGRPHQIRIHLASIGHPLLGDPLYAAGGLPFSDLPGLPGDGGYLLHAFQLHFTHPVTGEAVHLEAEAPDALRQDAPSSLPTP